MQASTQCRSAMGRFMPHLVRTMLWLAFFGIVLIAWWMMYAMAMHMGLDWIGRPQGGMAMMMEPIGTLNTGDQQTDKTVAAPPRL